jgi:hypothetical protein
MVLFGSLAMFEPARAQNEPYPVELKVGEIFDVCASGLMACPAFAPMCDAPTVAIPVTASEGSGGLGFRGVGPGTTLCSAASATGFRLIFRINVR